MNWFLSLLGYFWLTLGISAFIFTKTIKRHYSRFIIENHPKSMGSLAVLVGGLLISSSAKQSYYFAVFALGVIQVSKGLFLLFAHEKHIKKLISWWLGSSITTYRLWGIITMLMGLIILKARI